MSHTVQTKKKRIKRSTVVIIILILILAGLGGMIGWTLHEQQQARIAALEALANAPIPTTAIERGDLAETIGGLTGTLRSKQSVTLNWNAAGTVKNVNVELGDKVTKNQVLAELDEGTINASILEAAVTKEKKEKELENLITSDFALATAYNTMITAKKAIKTAQDAIDALGLARQGTTELNTYYQDYLNAQAFYQEALASFEELKSRPVDDFDRQMAQQMVEGAKSGMESAESTYNWYNGQVDPLDLKKAEATLKLRQAEYADAVRAYEEIMNGPTENQVRSLEAEINAAAATMKTSQIIAPIDGVITEVAAAPLDVIQTTTTGVVAETLAIRMDDLSAYYVDVNIHENKINAIALGQKVELTFDAVPLQVFTGTVANFSTVGTVTDNVVRYSVTIKLDGVSPELKPGMVADLKIFTKEYNGVLVVPVSAVGTNDEGESVVAVKQPDGTFKDVVVTAGYSDGKRTEIQGDGLTEGSEVRSDYLFDLAKVSEGLSAGSSFGIRISVSGPPPGGQPPAGGDGAPGGPPPAN